MVRARTHMTLAVRNRAKTLSRIWDSIGGTAYHPGSLNLNETRHHFDGTYPRHRDETTLVFPASVHWFPRSDDGPACVLQNFPSRRLARSLIPLLWSPNIRQTTRMGQLFMSPRPTSGRVFDLMGARPGMIGS